MVDRTTPDGYTVEVRTGEFLGREGLMGPLVVVPYVKATVFTVLDAALAAANTYPDALVRPYYLGDQ